MTRRTEEAGEIFDGRAGEGDRLSALERDAGRAVHPYRDGRDGLIVKRRALAGELERLERAAARRDRIAGELTAIDEELRARRSPLELIAIETPCRERWDAMKGDDVTRRCGRCQRDVHDLSRMTEAEIEALFARAGASPCVRLRRRPDGRVVTADCPVEPPSLARRTARALSAGVLFGAAAGASAAASLSALAPAPQVVAVEPLERREVVRQRAPDVDLRARRSREEPTDDQGFTMGDPGYYQVAPAEPSIATDDLDGHIRWIAPQAWEIDRELVERALMPTSGSVRTSRVIPHEEDGRVVGVKIYGVRRASVAGRLGIQNGDLLIDVNGHRVADPGAMFEAYARLRDADAIFLRLERRGEERLHVYRITP
jgi:hypothetical protein